LKEISIFKFPKRFLEISSRDLTSFLLQLIQRPDYQSINAVPFAFAWLNMPCKQQSDILTTKSETKEAEEATKVTKDMMRAVFQADLEKAMKAIEDGKGAMTAAASQMLGHGHRYPS
jgi:hypothetical protein